VKCRDVALAWISAEVSLLEYHLSSLPLWQGENDVEELDVAILYLHCCLLPDSNKTGNTGMDDVASLSSLHIKAKTTKTSCKDCAF